VSAILHAPVLWSDGTTRPVRTAVSVRREAGSTTPYVLVTPDEAEVRMTSSEALELARTLRHYAWIAEQDANARNAFDIGVEVGVERGDGHLP
jgi:hypothetical protein